MSPLVFASLLITQVWSLSETAAPQTLRLQDALKLVDERGIAVRVARADEESALAQQQRAFSVLMPRVDVETQYTLNCQLGGDPGVDCGDQTVQFVDDDFLSGQELLFHAVADSARAQAQQVPDPAQQQQLIATADALDKAGTTIGNTNNDPVVVAPAHIVTGSVTLSVPLLVLPAWTALDSAKDVAEFRKEAAREAQRQSHLAVTRAWLAAARQARVVDVAASRLADARTRTASLTAGEAVGGISPLVVDGARLEELAAETALVEARTAARHARARLGVLIGQRTDFALDDTDHTDTFAAAAPNDPDAVAAQAVQRRLEVKAAALQARVADRDGLAAWQGYVPEVRAFAQLRGTTNTGGFITAPFGSAVGVGLKWNLWDGGERHGRVALASSAGSVAEARHDEAAWSIEAEVRGAVVDVTRARAVLAVAERAVVVARARLAATELAVSTGVRSEVDLALAASARHTAEVDLISARVGVAAALVGVIAASGDDVQL